MKISKLLGCTALLSLVLTGQSVFAADPECEAAWGSSKASQSCKFFSNDITRSGESCVFKGYCPKSSGTQSIVYNDALSKSPDSVNALPAAVIPLKSVPGLNNCNGALKVGSC
ncbi:hypothetical protein [Pseudomonas sp. 3-2]|uniref:hypothetical protein n=1 Tax=Pseudomonas sp. 3-2 TaxID=2867408 RepID=UPI001C86E358|nr:hypothetical protein [Pseudomonas sp. 3-2]QZD73769.1 hypothetical protein K3819_13225 [Pseudomonas sp. 3-2]